MGLLIQIFIKDYKNTKDTKVRGNIGKLTSFVGIFLNLMLFASKLAIGTLFGVVSISADAFNNLSDAGSSIISLVSFIFSSKPADKDHPFGHERIEYVFSLLIAFIIMFFGIQLIIESVDKIRHPEVLTFHYSMIIVLVLSIVVKLYMYIYNTHYAKVLDSVVMRGAATDSISDVLATSAILLGLIASNLFGVSLDGYLGIVVALSIMKGGYDIIVDTLNKIIGVAPDDDFIESIRLKLLGYSHVLGIHDLVIHTYGANKIFASVHVEVDGSIPIIETHDWMDRIEHDFLSERNIHLVIHMDPIECHDGYTNDMRELLEKRLLEIDESLQMHDFRVIKGTTHNNFIFDVEVPMGFKLKEEELYALICEKVPQGDIPNHPIITIDNGYTSWVKRK